MKNILLIVSLFLSIDSLAQKIQGKVIDAQKQALVGVSIIQKGTNNGVVSNSNGEFELPLKANTNNEIQVSLVGYITRTVKSSGQGSLSIVLQEDTKQLNEVVVVGSRSSQNRTVVNSAVPVDIIALKDIQTTNPLLNVNDILNYLVPSFNANRQSASDGTEHIDPASLRGLGPDQVLVLINGKRRHTTSLVNYQNTVGNGSVGTDLNAIPVSAIDRIEVLRDGASAQYGSDAIAGVINIVLKKNAGFAANATGGVTSRGDGQTADLNLYYGTTFAKEKGHVSIATQFNNREKTSRSQNHDLIIFDQSSLGNFFAYDFTENPAASRKFDDDELKKRGLTRDDFNFQVGDAKISNIQAFVNSGYKVSEKTELYAFGGLGFRKGTGFGFRRLPSEETVVLSLFPNGFQPHLNSDIFDGSLAVGAKFKLGETSILDLSNTFGTNSFGYEVSNTNNASLGDKSPTSFNAGSHRFSQNTINIDYSSYLKEVLSGLNFAAGAEYRNENYQIKAGEEASYINGGAQSFPGFSPLNALNKSRHNWALYTDLEANLTTKFLVSGALRFEDYSDFGNTLNGKVAARYSFSDVFSIRGAYSTGFRAPSLHQQYFNNIATDVVDGVLLNSGIFTNDSPIAKAIGIPKLKQETSKNATVGFTISPSKAFAITVDAYQIQVDDRIVLTGNFGNDAFGDPIPELRAIFATAGASTGRFFTNAINTRTRGIDLVISHKTSLGNGSLQTSFSGNYNKNEVTKVNPLSDKLAGQEDIYYGPQERSLIETNSPNIKSTLQFVYSVNKISFMYRNTYFGKVTRNGFPFGGEQVHAAKVVVDITASYKITKALSATLGANNVFDVFPDKQIYENSYFGVFKYAPVQMGTTGRYMFARLSYNL
ncbi:TonB-dependent receptor [Flectobacillus major]|uniref:TonB-dependent receptor n=1 Tax=Flectobacillus major TaxID=103 RepID=UPI000414A5ED|nr:TonB-dependent receptor [Flectobacillus major]